MPEFPPDGTRVLYQGQIVIFECVGPDTLKGECCILIGDHPRTRKIVNVKELTWEKKN